MKAGLWTTWAIAATAATTLAAPLSYTGGEWTYTQNFDGMASTGSPALPDGWITGANLPTNTVATALNVAEGDAYAPSASNPNWGLTASPANRSLGAKTSGSARRIIQLAIKNNSSAPIESFTVLYDGEQWARQADGLAESLTLRYAVATTELPAVANDGSSGFAFVDAGTSFNFAAIHLGGTGIYLNGHAAANRQADIGGLITPATPIAPGQTLFIHWTDYGASRHQGFGIDNVRVSIVPEPASMTAIIAGGAVLRRRRRTL
jgi:hypothetical protein